MNGLIVSEILGSSHYWYNRCYKGTNHYQDFKCILNPTPPPHLNIMHSSAFSALVSRRVLKLQFLVSSMQV